MNVVGLIPAAGKARRLQPLPCSKEIYPIGFRSWIKGENIYPKPMCSNLFEAMRSANIQLAYIVIRKEKWDIPNYLGTGEAFNISFAYLIADSPFGVPFTVDRARPFSGDAIVAFGFPDIIFEPKDAFSYLLKRQEDSKADIVLGLFPASDPTSMDMVKLSGDGKILGVYPKPTATELTYTWIIAVWAPIFSDFIHDYLCRFKKENRDMMAISELYIGNVIHDAIDAGLRIEPVIFSNGQCLDLGTPESLLLANRVGIYSEENL